MGVKCGPDKGVPPLCPMFRRGMEGDGALSPCRTCSVPFSKEEKKKKKMASQAMGRKLGSAGRRGREGIAGLPVSCLRKSYLRCRLGRHDLIVAIRCHRLLCDCTYLLFFFFLKRHWGMSVFVPALRGRAEVPRI